MKDNLNFQYCQKIVVFNFAETAVLLAKRKGETDYDGVFSFIGGKLETSDSGLLPGLQREKNEEIGKSVKLRVCPYISYNTYFVKKDGNSMVLPHYFAIFDEGEIELGDEYSEYRWIDLSHLKDFKPKVETVQEAVEWAVRLRQVIQGGDLVII